MNVLHWIQQEKKVADYHVITWPTSHFHHPRNRTDIVAQLKSKPDGAAPASSGAQTQTEGLGFGLFDNINDRKYRSGGLGTDGMVADGLKDAVNNKVKSASRNSRGNQVTGPESSSSLMQTILPAEVYSVLNSAGQSALKVQSRIKQNISKLRDIYRKQSEQAADTQRQQNVTRKQPDQEQKGTRRANRDEVLIMQAESSYLLDSYDRNGQYSTLGKN